MINLYEDQIKAIDLLRNGSILCGGVGSGKSMTSLAYFFTKVCEGDSNFTRVKKPTNLYIITTAKKRDSLEWDGECAKFALSRHKEVSLSGIEVVIDSWNNIKKYTKVHGAFFIFDEQRVVGSGSWVKAFLQITRKNQWILLSATPGDTWMDYVPVFIANGYYHNRTEFIQDHVIYDRFAKYPKINRYVGTRKLERLRDEVLVVMERARYIPKKVNILTCLHDIATYKQVCKERKDPLYFEPIAQASGLCYTLRKIVNRDISRLQAVERLLILKKRAIVFYNFDYELHLLKLMADDIDIFVAEYNGHKHDPVPEGDNWVYLVQYNSGCEGWNCITTDTIIFFSLNYSYRMMVQASGRTDRLNTPYDILYYYVLVSDSGIDKTILMALQDKQDFNANMYQEG